MLKETTQLLPIGSVVMLKNGSKEVMITGFFIVSEKDPSVIYDYSACLYPEGIINSNENLLFNHDQIEKILFLGYMSEKEKTFKQKLAEGVKKLESMSNADSQASSQSNTGI